MRPSRAAGSGDRAFLPPSCRAPRPAAAHTSCVDRRPVERGAAVALSRPHHSLRQRHRPPPGPPPHWPHQGGKTIGDGWLYSPNSFNSELPSTEYPAISRCGECGDLQCRSSRIPSVIPTRPALQPHAWHEL